MLQDLYTPHEQPCSIGRNGTYTTILYPDLLYANKSPDFQLNTETEIIQCGEVNSHRHRRRLSLLTLLIPQWTGEHSKRSISEVAGRQTGRRKSGSITIPGRCIQSNAEIEETTQKITINIRKTFGESGLLSTTRKGKTPLGFGQAEVFFNRALKSDSALGCNRCEEHREHDE